MKRTSDFLDSVRSVFLPEKCIFCGEPILKNGNKSVCMKCEAELPYIDGKVCKKCGCAKKYCSCDSTVRYFDCSVSGFYYEDSVRKCLHNMKFNDKIEYCEKLADFMADTVRNRLSEFTFDYVTFVPMTKKEKRSRGYNQSEIMAKYIADKLGIEFKNNLIIKIYETARQSEIPGRLRSGNVLGAFDRGCDIDLSGKNILLVDDIHTSGASLSECGKVLYIAGAESVCCVSAAKTKMKEERL